MAIHRSKLALSALTLFTLFVSCLRESPNVTKSTAAGSPSNDQAAFEQRGIKAPATVMSGEADQGAVDIAELGNAIGEAQEASDEMLAKLEHRGNAAGNTRTAAVVDQTTVARDEEESEGDRMGWDEDNGSGTKHRPPPPPPEELKEAEKEGQKEPPKTQAPIEVLKPEPTPEAKPEKVDKGETTGGYFKDAQDATKAGDLEQATRLRGKDKKNKTGGEYKGGEADNDNDNEPARKLLPEIARDTRTGKLLVQGESGKLEPMHPRALRVIAYIQGSRARTIVDYVFENPYDVRLEGTFFHPLPADASPAGFAMFDGTKRVDNESFFQSSDLLPDLGDKMIDPTSFGELAPQKTKKIDWGKRKDARVVEQKRAREVYEDIVRHDIDPALMEWSGGSNFQARVFPIEPKSLKRIVVTYEQPLLFDGARFRYAYTLPSQPSLKEVEGVLFVDREQGKIVESPANAKPSDAGRFARFDLTKAAGAVLSCALETKSANVVLRGRDRAGMPGDSFYAEVRPFVATNGAEVPTNRALILVDTSLSSAEGGAQERRARLIESLLARDDTIKEYAVALFDVRMRWVSEIGWRPNNAQNREDTIDQLHRVFLEGATSFAGVLAELEKQRAWAIDGEKTTVFLLSDGEITWGIDKLDLLAARYPVMRDVRWISYRFGDAPVNQPLFDLLNSETGGRTVTLLSEEEIDKAALAHRTAPSELVSIEVRGAPFADVVIAGAPKQIFPGQTLRVAGRLPKGGNATLAVSIKTALSLDRVEIPLGTDKSDDSFAPRAWAELYAKKLIELDEAKLDRLVVALSQHYRLANARASFLVLDREEQAEQYQLKDETIDIANLELSRKREEDQRRDRLLGIGMEEVAPENRELVELIKKKSDGVKPVLRAQPLVDAPFSGGEERLVAEAEYRKQRSPEEIDFLLYDRVARARALAGDTAGAVRALSSVVELRPRDGESMRLIGYALLALAQYEVAAELFERLRLIRPFEPEVYLEEALALDALGRVDQAARNYEIVLARTWQRHAEESGTVARWHYARLLEAFLESAKLSSKERARIEQRRKEIAPSKVDFQLATFWSTDSVDIDLWIFEPNGEKCFYSHRDTTLGGKLYFDVTDGLGPELYHAATARPGQYDTLVHFYGSRAPRIAAPTAMLLVVDRGVLAPKGAASRKFQMRMLPKKDAVLMMRTDIFE